MDGVVIAGMLKSQPLLICTTKGFYMIKDLQQLVHAVNVRNGFWEESDQRNKAECIALMHSELSEALEALRDGDPKSDKIEGYSQVEEELADAVIRILDFCGGFNLDLQGAIIAKLAYNENRPFKHNKAF